MAIFSLEYPRLVLGGSEPPPFGPPPHAGKAEDDNLDFFKRTPQTKIGRDVISGLKHKQKRADHVTELWLCPIANHLSIWTSSP
jgi:hypothetical protein